MAAAQVPGSRVKYMLEMLRRSAPPPWRTADRCTLFYSIPHFEILPHSPQPTRGCGLLTTADGVESDSTYTSTVVAAAAALLSTMRTGLLLAAGSAQAQATRVVWGMRHCEVAHFTLRTRMVWQSTWHVTHADADARRRAAGGRPGRAARRVDVLWLAKVASVEGGSVEHSAAEQGVPAGRGACVREVARTGTVWVST